ncbi:FG-GAP repeat domain-containing protein [Negadavirga shengliensis]|uniref:FG-GAP repeat domain-containing protein n=1 Tax=Negadavirga shengliensis TaxID=1389218 RepID=A0ABV9T807_9BACT
MTILYTFYLLYGCFFLKLAWMAGEGLSDQEVPWKMHVIDSSSRGADGTKLTDVNGDGHEDIVVGWEEGGVTRLYINPGEPDLEWTYIEVPSPDVEDAFAVDLDGDGYMDLVTLSEGSHQRITVHWGPSDWELYYRSEHWVSQDIPVTIGMTRWMFGRPHHMDGNNGIDLVVGSKNPNGTLGWMESPSDPRNLDEWQYHELSPAGWVMSIELVDMNGNGNEDILLSDRYGEMTGLRWLERPETGNLFEPWANHFIGLQEGEPMFLGFVPPQNKENGQIFSAIMLPDLVRGWECYFKKDETWENNFIPYPVGSGTRGKSVAFGDINGGGGVDMVASFEGASGRSGIIGIIDVFSDSPKVVDISGAPGVKYDLVVLVDMDGDGDLDVLTSEETAEDGSKKGLGVIWYENPKGGNVPEKVN